MSNVRNINGGGGRNPGKPCKEPIDYTLIAVTSAIGALAAFAAVESFRAILQFAFGGKKKEDNPQQQQPALPPPPPQVVPGLPYTSPNWPTPPTFVAPQVVAVPVAGNEMPPWVDALEERLFARLSGQAPRASNPSPDDDPEAAEEVA